MIFKKRKSEGRAEAEKLDDAGLKHFEADRYEQAEAAWQAAAATDPDWATPAFSLGMLYKWSRRWDESLAASRQALVLNPKSEGACWNSGIAATALRDWPAARQAWKDYGIKLPEGNGEIRADFGRTPVRLNPKVGGEVVWGTRIDPARVVIDSIPLPSSMRRHGDIVLHDGEPRGERMLGQQAVPVFDELEVWQRSSFITFTANLYARDKGDYIQLLRNIARANSRFEDMSNVRVLCQQCSLDQPHEHHDLPDPAWKPYRRMLFATRAPVRLRRVLAQWAQRDTREVQDLQQALPEPKERRPGRRKKP